MAKPTPAKAIAIAATTLASAGASTDGVVNEIPHIAAATKQRNNRGRDLELERSHQITIEP